MNVVVIGGHERLEKDYKNIGKKNGYKVKVFNSKSTNLNKSIGNPHAIVLFTSTVSHKMAILAKSTAKKNDIPIIRHMNSSKCAFEECIRRIDECSGNCEECDLGK